MKKIFLLAGIAAVSFASAQQTDIFDIQEHLKNKNELNKKLTPDDLFIRPKNNCWESTNLPFSKKGLDILNSRVKSEILSELINSNMVDSIPENNMVFNFPPKGTINQTFPLAKLSHTLPNGNKVYLLPQDNMPCVVPDMTAFNMPVAKAEIIPNAIPNPAYPPSNINTDKLKELLMRTK